MGTTIHGADLYITEPSHVFARTATCDEIHKHESSHPCPQRVHSLLEASVCINQHISFEEYCAKPMIKHKAQGNTREKNI